MQNSSGSGEIYGILISESYLHFALRIDLTYGLSQSEKSYVFPLPASIILIELYYKVLEFMCWADSDVLPASCTWVFPCMGIMQVSSSFLALISLLLIFLSLLTLFALFSPSVLSLTLIRFFPLINIFLVFPFS